MFEDSDSRKIVDAEDEKTLEEAHGVICKSSLVLLEGTLMLTNKRLLFVAGDNSEDLDSEGAGKVSADNFKEDVESAPDFPDDSGRS